ncbi:hypothetical protein AUC71_13115 [Methyloceanibacter marginalis]|jgi:hypothetical protein|uniref:Uncharacterized protein n=1 Tax=Methyloceanibacter marginalis TaxID=1774971 RepID=A0A1E3WAI2_9HYPH|nr:hypothetical protein [Methyloceanibacter marginalis]ODS02834.1 hypothetical protein AUC71_13115 [Methyloceanibacter marginalis]
MTESQSVQIVDDPSVKEIYVNKLVSAAFDGACVSITLGVARVRPPGSNEANEASANVHVTVRLALSPATAVDLTKNLGKMLNTLKDMAIKRLGEQKPN